jgi:hypothetical protein
MADCIFNGKAYWTNNQFMGMDTYEIFAAWQKIDAHKLDSRNLEAMRIHAIEQDQSGEALKNLPISF